MLPHPSDEVNKVLLLTEMKIFYITNTAVPQLMNAFVHKPCGSQTEMFDKILFLFAHCIG